VNGGETLLMEVAGGIALEPPKANEDGFATDPAGGPADEAVRELAATGSGSPGNGSEDEPDEGSDDNPAGGFGDGPEINPENSPKNSPEGGLDDRELALKLFVVLSRAYRTVMDRAVKDMRKHGLSANEFMVLELLYHKGRVPLQQIGENILLTSGGITYTVDKLEGKGLVRRVPCTEDRRVIFAAITETGRKIMEQLLPSHAEAICSIMRGLSPEEKETAIRLVQKLGLAAGEEA